MSNASVTTDERSTPCEGFRGQACGKPVFGYVAQYCCNGTDCGCMGRPTEPCWCDECWAKWTASRDEPKRKAYSTTKGGPEYDAP